MTRSAKKTDKIAAIMAKKSRPQSRQARRLRLLIQQMLTEPRFDGNQRSVATALNIDLSLPSKFNRDPLRDVDSDIIERLLERFEPHPGMGLDPAFFTDASVPNPDYRNYLRPKDPKQRPIKSSKPALSRPLPATQAAGEVESSLRDLGATALERAAFDESLKQFEFPFVNGGYVLGFILGWRKRHSMTEAIDDGVNASIDEEIKKQNGD